MKNKYSDILSSINNNQRGVLDSVLILDGLNCFLRNFSVVNHLNPNGAHVGGLTGFLKSLGYAIKILDPTKVVILFDGEGGSNNRRNIFPEYKSNRKTNKVTNNSLFRSKEEENEEINNQINRLIHYLKVLPVSIICVNGLEADDIAGYLVNKLNNYSNTYEISLVSTDQDYLQLVGNKTKLFSPTKKKIYNQKEIFEEYGIRSNNFINYKALLGDSSDNIPGIKGLGPKKIVKLFPDIVGEKTLDISDIFQYALDNKSKHKLYLSLLENKEQIEINYKLMDLNNLYISPENEEQIKNEFTNIYSFNPHAFMSMFYKDGLGNSIPNTMEWLNQIFGPLTYIKQ